MSTEKAILSIVPGLQATNLVLANLPKKDLFSPKGKFNSKGATKNLVKGFVNTTVGIGLIGPTAKLINDLA